MSRSFALGLALATSVAVFAVASPGCDDAVEESAPPAEAATTEGFGLDAISLLVSASGNGEAVLLSVLPEAGGSIRSLRAGDRLEAAASDADAIELVEHGTSGYVGLLPTREASFELALVRDGGGEVRAAIELPEAFFLVVPEGPARIAEGFEITWQPATDAGATQTLLLQGSCVQALARPIEQDTGVYVMQPGDLVAVEPPSACSGSIALTRRLPVRPLALGPNGTVAVTQVRTARLDLAP